MAQISLLSILLLMIHIFKVKHFANIWYMEAKFSLSVKKTASYNKNFETLLLDNFIN